MDDVLAPNQVLTGMFMNVNNNPTFTPVSAQVASGSTVLFPNVSSDCVAEWRNRSISSLIEESFSIYVSDDGIYASG